MPMTRGGNSSGDTPAAYSAGRNVRFQTRMGKEAAKIDTHTDSLTKNMSGILERMEKGQEKRDTRTDKQFEALQKTHSDGQAEHTKAIAGLQGQINKIAQKMSTSVDKMAEYQKEEAAHQQRTVSEIIRNFAANGELSHATTPLIQAAGKLKESMNISAVDAEEMGASIYDFVYAICREDEATGTIHLDLDDPLILEISQGESGTRLKLTRTPTNIFERFSQPCRRLYITRDGVHNQQDYLAKVAKRICINCDKNALNMPHLEGVCPGPWCTDPESEAKIGKARRDATLARFAKLLDLDVKMMYKMSTDFTNCVNATIAELETTEAERINMLCRLCEE